MEACTGDARARDARAGAASVPASRLRAAWGGNSCLPCWVSSRAGANDNDALPVDKRNYPSSYALDNVIAGGCSGDAVPPPPSLDPPAQRLQAWHWRCLSFLGSPQG